MSNAPIKRRSANTASPLGRIASDWMVTPVKSTLAARLVSSTRVLLSIALSASCDDSTITSTSASSYWASTRKKSLTDASCTSNFFPSNSSWPSFVVSSQEVLVAPQSSLSNNAKVPMVPFTIAGSHLLCCGLLPPRAIA